MVTWIGMALVEVDFALCAVSRAHRPGGTRIVFTVMAGPGKGSHARFGRHWARKTRLPAARLTRDHAAVEAAQRDKKTTVMIKAERRAFVRGTSPTWPPWPPQHQIKGNEPHLGRHGEGLSDCRVGFSPPLNGI